MSDNQDILYIFLHIPRCAGTTIARHLRYNLPRGSRLLLSPTPQRKFQQKEEVDGYIESLPERTKRKVKVIIGHSVYYGIHRYFQRPARYITFLRDPVDRVISNYNYFMEHYDFFVRDNAKGQFPQNKDNLSFDQWWQVFQGNLQVGVVLNYMAENKPGWHDELELNEKHLTQAKQILNQFYFVGTTENFSEDALFLYHELGIRRFLKKRQNTSHQEHIQPNERITQLILQKSALDVELYSHARQLNSAFKKERSDYYDIIENVQKNGKFITPFRSILIDNIISLFGMKGVTFLDHMIRKMKIQINERR